MAKRINFEDRILLETADFIFWDKPADMACLKERGDVNAIYALNLARGYYETAKLCHRIDKQTSGILLLAKNAEAHRWASMQFQNKTVVKKYFAFVHGQTHLEKYKIDLPIWIDERKRTVRIDKSNGKPSVTIVDTLKNYTHYSLVSCDIKTGRMHQIRIHLSTLGHPIVQDELYGGKPIFLSQLKKKYILNKTGEEKPLINRFALHAGYLCIKDMEGAELTVEAPFPKDMAVLQKQLDSLARV